MPVSTMNLSIPLILMFHVSFNAASMPPVSLMQFASDTENITIHASMTSNVLYDTSSLNTDTIYKTSTTINGWYVERLLYPVEEATTQEVKPPGYLPSYFWQTQYTVIKIADSAVLLILTPTLHPEFFPQLVFDPIMKDVDFDLVPDLWIPNERQPKMGNGYAYYGYNPKTDKMEELFISTLQELVIDSNNKKATGFRYVYHVTNYNQPGARIDYELSGYRLQDKKETKTDLYYPTPVQPPSPTKLPIIYYRNQLIGRYRVTWGPFTSTNQAEIGYAIGDYAEKIQVIDNISKEIIFGHIIRGNHVVENNAKRQHIDLSYINFDSIPDIRIPSLVPGQPDIVFLSCTRNDLPAYNSDIDLGWVGEVQRNEIDKSISGSYEKDGALYQLIWQYDSLPTLTITKRPMDQPQTGTVTIFNHECSKRYPINKWEILDPQDAKNKVFIDYNFDGYKDYSIKSSTEKNSPLAIYIYQPRTGLYQTDSTWSNLVIDRFDPDNKLFMAYQTNILNGDTDETETVYYKVRKKELIPQNKLICTNNQFNKTIKNCEKFEWQKKQWVKVNETY